MIRRLPIRSGVNHTSTGPTLRFGFTLVEMLFAMAVTALIVLMLLSVLDSTANVWRRSTERAKSFASARAAFSSMVQTISAATLNTYQDYYDSSRRTRQAGDLGFRPAIYGRRSDLHFIAGNRLVEGQQGGALFFTVPFDYDTSTATPSTSGQLNGVGYFVRFSPHPSLPEFITNNPPRYRLFQFLQPTRNLKVMNVEDHPGSDWITQDVDVVPPNFCYPLADNIVAFAVLPKLSEREDPRLDSLSADFSYDTRMSWESGSQPTNMHQLPPVVRIVMVALDEASAQRLQSGDGTPDLGYDPATIFARAADLEESIDTITASLTERRLNFRVFRAEIPIRTAKWTSDLATVAP